MLKNFFSSCAKPIQAASKAATSYVGSKMAKKDAPITKVASRKDDDSKRLREWFWGLVIAASVGLGGWALKSTVDLYAEMKEEKALRSTSDTNMEKLLESYRLGMEKAINDAKDDAEKRLAEYKAENDRRLRELRTENDRRLSEIQKQLEILNTKLDRLLTRP